ncbi:hypothetical protein H311_01026 [Anncaliia algerae PRA109]|nr:hypothetical protein H311_01026 [Anncaliia algerae PRA109]
MTEDINMIRITETWLKRGDLTTLNYIERKENIPTSHKARPKNGMLLRYRNNCSLKWKKVESPGNNIIAVEVVGILVIFVCIHIENLKEEVKIYFDFYDEQKNNKLIIMGDFNANEKDPCKSWKLELMKKNL